MRENDAEGRYDVKKKETEGEAETKGCKRITRIRGR